MCDRFVGRERELGLLDGLLRAAVAGDGQVVLVAGEPGAGKTRLAEEVAARASGSGMVCGWGRATREEGSPPYWVFRQVLRRLSTGSVAGEQLGATPELSAVAPDVAGAAERFGLFEAVSEFLVRAAEPSGLLVVLDDLQWADPASLRLLVHLAEGAREARLAVVCCYRDTEVGEPLRDTLAELAGEPVVTRVGLAGLAEPEVAAQLAGVTGWAVPGSVAAAVWRRTRGNPFFVGELGRLLVESPEYGHEELPAGIRDAVRGRLGRLSTTCRDVVSAAAVLGSEPDATALAASTGCGVAQVLAALDEATEAGVVAEGRFAHDLIREVAWREVPTATRHAVHGRMAVYLSGLADAEARVAEIAFHRLESLPTGDAAAAVSWAERAAEQAMAQLAWEEADALYGRAVTAATKNPGFTPGDRSRLLVGRARAQVRAYDVGGARRSVLAAADIARGVGDAETIARAALAMEGVSDVSWDATGRELCEEALAGLPEVDSAMRARLLAHAVVAGFRGTEAQAEPRSAAALAMAERVGDRRAVVAALRARQFARCGPDGAADRLALGDRMLEIGAGGYDEAAMWGRLWRFDALVQLGDLDQAEAELAPITAVTDRLRSPLARWHDLRSRAVVALGRGRFADAEALGVEAAVLGRRARHPGGVDPGWGFLVVLATLTGNAELVPELSQTAQTRNPLVACWHVAMGRRTQARRIFRALPPPASVPRFVLLELLAYTAQLAAEFDDREAAADAYRLLSPFAELFVSGGAGVEVVHGSARLPLGQAAATMGRLDDAVRHLRAAAEANERAGMSPFAASARYWLARVLARRRRPGDRAEAAALAASAAASAQTLGMAPLRSDAAELTARLEDGTSGPLTRRERQIAVLVSQGLSNRQIAAAVHISERTAESHVQHILGKLGFTSRSQIAAWVVEEEIRTGSP